MSDSDERRSANVELLLIESGKLHEIAKNTQKTVDELSIKVGIQNGRVGKLEKWQSFLYGIAVVLTLLVIPLALKYFPSLIQVLVNQQ